MDLDRIHRESLGRESFRLKGVVLAAIVGSIVYASCGRGPAPAEASAPLTDDQKIWVVECVSRASARGYSRPAGAIAWCTSAAHKLTARGML